MSGKDCLNAIPATLVFLLYLWSIYVYIYEMCIYLVNNLIEQIIYSLLISIMYICNQVVFFLTMCDKDWYVPDIYAFSEGFYRELMSLDVQHAFQKLLSFCRERGFQVYMRTNDGNIRYCKTCLVVKPDRAHHCSTCQTCVLRMDHHCPWLNNCIGWTNYKYFVIFVAYSAIYCTFYSATSLQYSLIVLWQDWDGARIASYQVIAMCFISFVLALILWRLFFKLYSRILRNKTTFETIYRPIFMTTEKTTFSLGEKDLNCHEECGTNCCLWYLPIRTARGNGCDFQIRTLCIIALVLGFVLWILFIYQLTMILRNETTLESIHPPSFMTVAPATFSLGSKRLNFLEQCGSNCCLWCIPVHTASGNGYNFEIRIL